MPRTKSSGAPDVPPSVDALKLSPVDRLDRLHRELRAATLWLQRHARAHGHRCDSPEQADALATLIARDGAEPDLAHALAQYQSALARLTAEIRRSEVPNEVPSVTRRAAPAGPLHVKPSASRGAAPAHRDDLEPANPASPGQHGRVGP